MLYMLLVFAHLLAASTALGAIVATDLRLMSKLAADKVRIAPPNKFVTRIVMTALLLLYVTGAAIVVHGLGERPDYLENPKLQAKILLVVLLTINAFVLHRVTFPRLAVGRRVRRWNTVDWLVVAVPVALSNFLWMFVAFLGIARPLNYGTPMRDILEIAAALYLVSQLAVVVVFAAAGRKVEAGEVRWADRLAHSLAAIGNLGIGAPGPEPVRPAQRRRPLPPQAGVDSDRDDASLPPIDVAISGPPDAKDSALPSASAGRRPSLRLVADRTRVRGAKGGSSL